MEFAGYKIDTMIQCTIMHLSIIIAASTGTGLKIILFANMGVIELHGNNQLMPCLHALCTEQFNAYII